MRVSSAEFLREVVVMVVVEVVVVAEKEAVMLGRWLAEMMEGLGEVLGETPSARISSSSGLLLPSPSPP